MIPSDYFEIADFLANLKHKTIPKEICIRTAINRLYYGVFHLVQLEFGISIPKSQLKRCHAFVKENIEESDIRSDYSDLEVYRVSADYYHTNNISFIQYEDALKIKMRILSTLSKPESIPYDDDENFFFNIKGK